MDELERNIQIIEQADAVEERFTGARPSQVSQAYAFVAERLEPQLRPRLDRMLDRATAAGKVYAVMLLLELDPCSGSDAWSRLHGIDDPIEVLHAGGRRRTTVSGYATSHPLP